MEIRTYDTERDGSTISQWWAGWGSPAWPERYLSREGGLVAESQGKPVAAVWVSPTDSELFVLGPMVADPAVDKDLRREASLHVIEAAKIHARGKGATALLSFTENKGLVKSLEKCGFTPTNSGIESFCAL